ncbi:ATP-binding protein [Rhizohabitans arisaemae]|uniref:ATP-binding protein n=1 Tax=Rhizohabitans arisaemae TaxID=2720610 RepID=UPI0024B1D601|nr:ATP-binding protein [Rhizohabitans arisaemae]
MTTAIPIRPRERDALIQSLRAGVVPRLGQWHVQVGRSAEVQALVTDIDRLGHGGSAVRFVIGDFGAGKTFFLHLVRSIALERRLVTVHADLTPDRRLHSTKGQARSLYAEMMRNMATRAKPDGGALSAVVERFVSTALEEAQRTGTNPGQVIRARLAHLAEMTGGYDFAEVVAAYWRGHDNGDEQLKSAAVRWLRGEFSTKTDARAALGVRTIVDDATFHDHLKLMSVFVRLAGYEGLLVCLDEMVNLYKLATIQARNSNYEQILRIFNDTLQGSARHLGFVFGGTPEFLTDTRRGLYSYAALQSRLAENTFAGGGLVDYSGPVLRLSSLTQEDLYVLLTKIRHVYALGNPQAYLVPDDGLYAFMQHCASRIGEAYFRTPRMTIKAFCDLLAVIEQNPGVDWRRILSTVDVAQEGNPDLVGFEEEAAGPAGARGDDDFATFRL